MENKKTTTGLPSLPISTLFAMTFGFFGVNMAFSLQSSQMGRIFQTIGADPRTIPLRVDTLNNKSVISRGCFE